MEFKTLKFEVKATAGDGSTGDGIAAAFHNIDAYYDIIAPGAFVDDIADFLEGGFMGGLNHDWDNPIGKFTDAREVKEGLAVSWVISDTTHGKDVKILLKDKVVRKLSIGYETLGQEWLETEDAVRRYWDKHGYTPSAQDESRAKGGGVRLLTRIHNFEASPVVVPANDRADVRSVKAARIETIRDLETYLREAGGMSKSQAVLHAPVIFGSLRRESAGDEKRQERRDASPVAGTSTEVLRLKQKALQRQREIRLGATL
jgi:HK97 family phage prohead protease